MRSVQVIGEDYLTYRLIRFNVGMSRGDLAQLECAIDDEFEFTGGKVGTAFAVHLRYQVRLVAVGAALKRREKD